MNDKRIMAGVFLSALLFFSAFNTQIAISDPVEANYALTAKEMLLSGDWLTPRIYGEYWFDKPALTYWLIILCYKLFGINEFAARFPSAFFSAASITFVYWFSFKLYASNRTAILSALVLATSLEYWVLARMVITDAILFFFFCVTMAMFYLGIRNTGKIYYAIAYAAAGMAVMTKGPVGVVLPGIIAITYIAVTRKWSQIRHLFLVRGLIIFFAVAAPWYCMMYSLHGMDFVNMFLGLHNYLRATVSEHPQDNVFYYYLILFPVSLLPWAGVLIGGIINRQMLKPLHYDFLLTWMLTIILFYSLMATKYLTYVFPAMFPAAMLIGYYLHEFMLMDGRRRWLWLSGPATLMFALLAIATERLPSGDWSALYCATIISIAIIIWLQLRGKTQLLPIAVSLSTVVLALVIVSVVFIPLASTRSSKEAVAALPSSAKIAVYGNFSTSAVFYSNKDIRLLSQAAVGTEENVWSKKYNIPWEKPETFLDKTQNDENVFILLRIEQQAEFEKSDLGKSFIKHGDYGRISIFQRRTLPVE